MEYVLSLLLMFGGDLHLGVVVVDQASACMPVAQEMAAEAGAKLIGFSCVLEVGV